MSETAANTKIVEDDEIQVTASDHANKLIRRYTAGALAPGLIPLPLADLAVLTGLQLTMVGHLAKTYDVKFSKTLGKSLIGSLVCNAAGVGFSPAVASLFKIVPGIGSFYGAATVSALGSSATYAVGKVFKMHFETGGTLLDFDPDEMRSYFTEQLAEAKTAAPAPKKGKA